MLHKFLKAHIFLGSTKLDPEPKLNESIYLL